VPSNQNEPHERLFPQGHRWVTCGLQRKYFPVSDMGRTEAHWLMWTLLGYTLALSLPLLY